MLLESEKKIRYPAIAFSKEADYNYECIRKSAYNDIVRT
jgi:hypothetical protein